MTLSPAQAADSLKEIEKAQWRSASAYSYAQASPYFILWGVIWIFGYAGSDLIPHYAGHHGYVSDLWLALTAIGIAGCFAIGRNRHGGGDPAIGRAMGLRVFASFAVIYVFVALSFLVMRPANPMASAAFAPLVVAMFYGLMGVWKGLRFLVAGAVLAALTMAGLFFLREDFLLWMAVVGSGALILAGLWLRKV